jgi:filamentous hemagglutinin family protein
MAVGLPVHANTYSLRAGAQTNQGSNVTRGQAATVATAATNQAQATSMLAQHTQATLLHSVQALQAMQAAQAAARSGAGGVNNLGSLPTVPDGLARGGLVPNSGLARTGVANPVVTSNPLTTWVNANTPVQTSSQGQTTVTVQQTGQQALLRWNSFNIGRNTTLAFDQSLGGANAGQWVAINKVAPNIAPSQILGSITAQGQVYVLNQNGIIFGGKSQVNVGALVASSLPINNNNNTPNNSLVGRGLLNNPDYQFLFSQIDIPAGTKGPTDAFQPQENSPAPTQGVISQADSSGNLSVVKPKSQDGDVVVLPGAQLTSADTPEHVGGKIALIGPNVVNAGTINTPDGQAILAAGLQVGLLPHNTNDASLRGLDVSVGNVAAASYAANATGVAGTASNAGLIEAPRADVTMVGKNVNQNGVIDSSTSVSLNGRIDLLANYNAVSRVNGISSTDSSGTKLSFTGASDFYPTATGAVTFGANSLTQILPELSSSETIVGAQLALPSLVNVEAQTIHFASNATLLAPGASVPYPYAQGATTPSIFAYDENTSIPLTSGVTLNAGNWALLSKDNSYLLENPSGSGQVYFDSGSSIDVSGSSGVSASVTENIVTAQLLGTELANSPLQRTGSLRGSTIQFDLRAVGLDSSGTPWIGTPLADVSGYVNLVQHTVGELTTAGGSVGINAGNSVVMQSGSAINVSGGYINYQGGNIQTTRVIQRGQIIDIAQANPDFAVDGIYNGYTETSAKWNVSQTFQNRLLGASHYQAGYLQGGNGGSISITAPVMALDGNFYGNTVAGVQQTTTVAQLTKTYGSTTNFLPTIVSVLGEPAYGALSLSFQTPSSSDQSFLPSSPTPPQVIFTSNSSLPAVGSFGAPLSASRLAEVDLSPDLVSVDGFGSLTLNNSEGNILLPAKVSLQAPVGGSIALSGANIDIEGSITAPSGQLSFTTYDFSKFILASSYQSNPAYDPTRGLFTLGANALLNTAGQMIDNREIAVAPGTLPSVTNGGSVNITSYNVNLISGSSARTGIDVSGGLQINSTGKFSYGNGGSIDIEAGQDVTLSSVLGGHLVWDPQMTKLVGYSGAKGGSLTLKAPSIQIGGNSLLNGDTVASAHTLWLNPTDANGNLLQPDFFDQGGFASFKLKSIGQRKSDSSGNLTGEYIPGTFITPNTVIAPQALTLVAKTDGANIEVGIEQLPVGQRAPVNLSFGVSGASDPYSATLLSLGAFVMGEGAVIQTDPQTNPVNGVSINAKTVTVLGSIIAPGGAISITGGSDSTALQVNLTDATPTLYLGPKSLLSAAGTTVLSPNALGFRTGSVLPGGSITLDGNIFAQAGAVLDVSGASGILDTTKAAAGTGTYSKPSTSTYTLNRVDSNGGSITFTGEQGLVTDATLRGAAGGPSAQGGTVTVSSGHYPIGGNDPTDPNLVVTQTSLPDYASGQLPIIGSVIGNTVLDGSGINPLSGNDILETGFFTADSFNSSGFDSLILEGTVKFSGPVTINANRSITVASQATNANVTGQGGVIFADATVNLNAPYVALGQPFQPPSLNPTTSTSVMNVFTASSAAKYFSPKYGTGNLIVSAGLIDLGNLSLQGIGKASLTAANGDIRGNGVVDIAGAISLTAGQIYPTTENTFTIAAYDYNGMTGNSSITIAKSGDRQLPLSAGGVLNLYASNITQGGVLRAPLGTINIGSGIVGATPIDGITGYGLTGTPTSPIPITQNLTLAAGSTTSVSAVDPQTGQALTLPYGINTNGVEWDDPAGNNITLAGNTSAPGSGINAIPDKTINISGVKIDDQAGSTIDISGGGNLLSYTFVKGTGGTNDILASSNSYAILPGYQGAAAPYYSASDYANGNLAVGEQVYLNASKGLPAGYYTLLPARYALLPGAFLVTPTTGTPYTTAIAEATGFSIVSGYQVNGLDKTQVKAPLQSLFKISPPSVVAASAQYDISYATTYLSQSAQAVSASIPLLPLDAGHLILAATNQLTVQGSVNSQASAGGLGGLVDIATPRSILVYGPHTDLTKVSASTLELDSSGLSGFGAGSLLIGGYRQRVGSSYDVTVTTNNLTIDNAGASVVALGQTLYGLSAPDVILVSRQDLTLASGATIQQSPVSSSPPATALALSGDGALLRVSSNVSDSVSRGGYNTADSIPSLVIDSGAKVSGYNAGVAANITLDSSSAINLDSSVVLKADAVNLDSGQIVIELGTPDKTTAPLNPNKVFILSGSALNNLQSSAQNLSLLSYSSLDIYGSGTIGGAEVSGNYPVDGFTLHASEIRGFSDNQGGRAVTINAQQVNLDNSPGGASLGATTGAYGSLTINAGTIRLGTNQINIDQYNDVNLNASNKILLLGESKSTQTDGTDVVGQGSLIAAGNLTLSTPLICADSFNSSQAAPNQIFTAAGGNLVINGLGTLSLPVLGGLGASVTLTGKSIVENSAIELPSGSVTVHATTGDLTIGGVIDVAGTAQEYNTLTKYTSGGQISLVSDQGSVNLGSGSSLQVQAPAGGGNAGQISIAATKGSLAFNQAEIKGAGGAGGQNGIFSLDAGSLSNLDVLDPALNSGGFTLSRSIRVRTGDVAVNGVVTAQTFDLSTDSGSILVNGKIDASGLTGGSIDLSASGNVTLASGSVLTVAAQNFSDAGKGGSVTLEAGAETNGVAGTGYVTIGSGSTIDLSVDANTPGSSAQGDLTGVLHLRAPQTASGSDLQVNTIAGNIIGASSVIVEGYKIYNLTPEVDVTSSSTSSPTVRLASVPSDLLIGSALLGSTVQKIVGTTITLASAANANVSSTTPEAYTPEGQVTVISSSLNNNSVTLASVPAGNFGPGSLLLGSTVASFDGVSQVTLVSNANTAINSRRGTVVSYTPENGLIFTPDVYGDGVGSSVETNVYNDAQTFANNTGKVGTAGTILNRLLGGTVNAGRSSLFQITPGAEIINTNVNTTAHPTAGDLTLLNTWDLSTFRFGPNANPSIVGSGVPGILTLRAGGNVVFNFGASLSDGFDGSNSSYDLSSDNPLWTAPLLSRGSLSWSYQITAGSDFSAASPPAVLPTASTSRLNGSVIVGQGAPALPTNLSDTQDRNAVLADGNSADNQIGHIESIDGGNTSLDLSATNQDPFGLGVGYFQTIRTGTGNITIAAGGDVLLLNNVATIYTAGTQAPSLPGFTTPTFGLNAPSEIYGVQYSLDGGNVSISAQGNIAHETPTGQPDSSKELPTTWLYRQGSVNAQGNFNQQTSWWVDFSNFLEGVGALGGGDVTLTAGLSINNVDAVAPTNARMSGTTPNAANLVELGGGDVTVKAGQNINGGVYYVERGQGTLDAGDQILTNVTRATVNLSSKLVPVPSQPTAWLPTTLFLGQGNFVVSAGDDLLLGPVANPFLLPQGVNNTKFNQSYFSTYASTDSVAVSSLAGNVMLKDDSSTGNGSLSAWYIDLYFIPGGTTRVYSSLEPWLLPAIASGSNFVTVAALLPPTLDATAFSSDINLIGSLTLMPANNGTINLLAAGSLNGFQINDISGSGPVWSSSVINLSDADPASFPAITSPLSSTSSTALFANSSVGASLFAATGASEGLSLQTKGALHADLNGNPLHADDPQPVHLFAQSGDISGFTLYSGKATQVVAGQDITDVGLYIQNTGVSDVSVVSAGRDIIPYDENSPLRVEASNSGVTLSAPNSGDIQIAGPGTLEVLAGRDLNLGIPSKYSASNAAGTNVGISSVGNAQNSALPFAGANVVAAAGVGGASSGLEASQLDFAAFTAQFLTPGQGQSARYLPDLGSLMGLPSSDTDQQVWDAYKLESAADQSALALDIFYDVIRDAGRDHNDPTSPNAGTYTQGFAAIQALFPGNLSSGSWPAQGDISLTSREIKTTNGGDIDLLAPGGQLNVGFNISGTQALDQGILTEDGGNVSIFAENSINVGTSRIFTLHGGNVIIWSTTGDIAAGSSSKTVQSAPPTRVLVDPQSGDIQTDLAGLATGGGIGVLETVVGAPPADVDLIAPNGTVDAGDAGIRASGNINISAVRVLNAGNIQAGGKTTGTPTTSTPNIAGISAASSASSAVSNSSSAESRPPTTATAPPLQNPPSIISVEVLGYGGDDSDN